MLNNKSISVIIPAYNEEDYLDETLSNLNFQWIDQVIVVNDGSMDNTSRIASKYKVDLFDLKKNQGKGNAINYGLLRADGDIITIIDADLGKSVVEIRKLIEPLLNEDKLDISIAVLPIKGGGLGIVRKTADLALKCMTKNEMRAPLSGQRAFKKDILEKIYPLQEGFGLEMGFNLLIFKHNLKFVEVECGFKHRVTKSNFSGYMHRGLQLHDILKTLWEMKKNNYV
ncbi:MAG: glycosyltransferase family 2 protein [Halanaerobiaceae bacterium]